jgi:disulfide bond formation protein DsbB
MKRDVLWILSGLGLTGQVLVALLVVIGLLALLGARGPLETLRRWLWGYELWAAFVVAAVATGGSLFYSQVAGFIPCEFCWFQRICMYPLSITLLLMAIFADNRAARYLLALPIVGAGASIWHMLIGYKVIAEPVQCSQSAPGGCGTNWLALYQQDVSLGYLRIEVLAFTAFLLLIGFLVLASAGSTDDAATLAADA